MYKVKYSVCNKSTDVYYEGSATLCESSNITDLMISVHASKDSMVETGSIISIKTGLLSGIEYLVKKEGWEIYSK